MKTRIDDGGPAYPLPVNDEQCHARFDAGHGGMSLRDAFAIAALQGLLQRKDGFMANEYGTALDAYNLADAMLRARSIGETNAA